MVRDMGTRKRSFGLGPPSRVPPDPSLISPYRLVLWRGQLPQLLESAGVDGSLSEIVHMTQPIAPLRIAPVFVNACLFATTPYGEVDGNGNIKVRFAWERCTDGSTGTVVQGTFSGADQGTIAPGQVLVGDFVEGSSWSGGGGVVGGRWPASTMFSFKTEVTVAPTTIRWPAGITMTTTYTDTGGLTGSRTDANGRGTIANLGSKVYAQGAIDLTGLTARPNAYAPAAYIGQYATGDGGYASMMWIGDSISDTYSGANQINWAAAGTDFTGNFVTRALRASKQSGCQASLASSAQITGYPVNAKMRKAIMPYCSQLYIQDCTNDFVFGFTAAASYAILRDSIIPDALARGVKQIIASTALPRCTNVDNFLTVNNPPISAVFDLGGEVDIYKSLLQGEAGSLKGVDQLIDLNLAVSYPLNRHFWDFNGVNNFARTGDGVHPRGTNATPQPNGLQLCQNYFANYSNAWTL